MLESKIMCHRSGKKLEIVVAGQYTEARRREFGDRDPSEIGFSVQNDQNFGDRGIIPDSMAAEQGHEEAEEKLRELDEQ